jgi:hypothetical protein
MSRINRAIVALVAVFAFGAIAASSASAGIVLFLTQSGHELLFTAHSGVGILRGLNLGVLGTITCELDLVHGFVLNASPLAHRIKVLFEGKCEEKVGSSTVKCEEPIHVNNLLGELGLVGSKKVGFLLAPSSGTEFVETKCEGNNTKVEGAVVGEFPEINKAGEEQYNKQLTKAELVFASEASNENQKITTIELLGVSMTGAKLKVQGFFGGNASEETTDIIEGDGWIEICIH